jgi:hypothetical protein
MLQSLAMDEKLGVLKHYKRWRQNVLYLFT